ncbi:hypothetical protein KQI84_17210 [bacterium]|nr:hypothetical protein [bacterium]
MTEEPTPKPTTPSRDQVDEWARNPEKLLEHVDQITDPERRSRVHKRRYVLYFFLFTLLFSIGSVQVFHQEESGFLRLQRMYQRQRPFATRAPVSVNERELARELGISLEDYYTAEKVIDRFQRKLEDENLGPLDWAVRLNIGDYTIVFSYRIFLNMAISCIIALALYLRARDRAASGVIDEQNRRLRDLNEELERKVNEAQNYLDELQQAQSKLLAAEKLASIGRMSATLAHEIRNPMTIIMSSAGMVAEDLDPGSPQLQAIDLIREEVSRLNNIINELLNFARPKPPRLEMHRLNQLVNAWMPRIQEEMDKYGIDLDVEIDPAISEVIVDSDQLYQVFLNVIWNARDAINDRGEGGRIQIQTEEAGRHGVFLTIRDDGPGMDEETLNQVYEPFYTTKTHGSGLGLPVVQQLMEGMSGSAYVDSEKGKGTTVHLLLRTPQEHVREQIESGEYQKSAQVAENPTG